VLNGEIIDASRLFSKMREVIIYKISDDISRNDYRYNCFITSNKLNDYDADGNNVNTVQCWVIFC